MIFETSWWPVDLGILEAIALVVMKGMSVNVVVSAEIIAAYDFIF